jgi:antibiotic biosynthesis monooxygenase (ABM) superfamily enzyme
MPIHVHVKHYLNEDGRDHFGDWFDRVEKFMSKQKGYLGLTSSTEDEDDLEDNETLFHIKLSFNSTPELEAWLKFPEHDKLVNELDDYRSRPYWFACRTENDKADWKKLDYDEIEADMPSPLSSPR